MRDGSWIFIDKNNKKIILNNEVYSIDDGNLHSTNDEFQDVFADAGFNVEKVI
jgi:hypothetical protein